MADELVKILFRFYSEILDEETTEIMWAEIVDLEKNYYRINNIPFYVPKLASGDLVWAEYNEAENMLTYRKTIEYSGNSIIHIIIMDDKLSVDAIRVMFDELGCDSEKINNYFALEVPAYVDYQPVKKRLDELENDRMIDYAESCLSENHQYKSSFL
jgi:hypothetical protein